MLTIDGAYGEGGGQILRTSLALSAILKQPVRITNIRANRKNPGLAAQHLTAVRAAAITCQANLTGDTLGATELTFDPQSKPIPGNYQFDVAEARQGGSAGAASLVLQTVLLPLALARGNSAVTIKGGTHVAWSPSFHYLQNVYLPTIAQLGLQATASLTAWGWYPGGEGEIKVEIAGQTGQPARAAPPGNWPARGQLRQITGLAVAANLPAHIAQRICNRAVNLLNQAGLPVEIAPQRVRSYSPGAGLFLTAKYEHSRAGFTALGKRGKPSEQVAQEAVDALLRFHRSGAALDRHLTDQMILPLALAGFTGQISAECISEHTLTNIWAVEQFLGPVAQVNRNENTIRFTESKL